MELIELKNTTQIFSYTKKVMWIYLKGNMINNMNFGFDNNEDDSPICIMN